MPVALWVEGPHGPVIHATSRAAELAGVQAGARVADMRAVCPALRVVPADPEGDRDALERLAFWARRWCPWTATDGADGLALDVTGAAHLKGGEAGLLADIEARLSGLGLSARPALAPTWGAAWALARHGPPHAICHDLADLAPLPAAALRLDADTVLLLRRLGLKTVGALSDLPRQTLARRFVRAEPAANPLVRLDQATGRLAEPLSAPDAPTAFRAVVRLAEPALDPVPFLPGLCRELCDGLAAARQGCRRLRLALFRVDGEARAVAIAAAMPSRDPDHLLRLFDGKLDRIDPGFGFDALALEALETEPLAEAQGALAGGRDATLELARLVDRLTARLGPRAVSRPVLRESHVPERAEAAAAPMAPAPSLNVPSRNAPPLNAPSRSAHDRERPLRLFEPAEEVHVLYAVPEGPPVQFRWRRRTCRVTRYEGPERIAPEWWRDRPSARLRDYFKIEDETGRRYWLYREGLHDDGRGGPPRWFLHGAFA